MSPRKDSFTYHRSRLAVLTRQRAPQSEIDEARRTLNAARLRDQISAALEAQPRLTIEQRGQLASLLNAPNGGAE